MSIFFGGFFRGFIPPFLYLFLPAALVAFSAYLTYPPFIAYLFPPTTLVPSSAYSLTVQYPSAIRGFLMQFVVTWTNGTPLKGVGDER